MSIEFKLPDLGENIASGDVIGVLVEVGDKIDKHQPVIELETDKAVVEVPSSAAGVVEKIHVKTGDKASVGQLILTLAKSDAAEQPPQKTAEPPAKAAEKAEAAPKIEKPKPEPVPARIGRVAEVVDFSARSKPAATANKPAPASPSVRRLAREIGVDIRHVAGSGPKGRISQLDVKEFAKTRMQGGVSPSVRQATPAPLPDFSRWGEVRRDPFSNVRRKTAEHMTRCWLTVPHVTQNDKCDITALEERRKRYSKKVEASGGKLTVTAIVVKVAAAALKLFPQFNASIDVASEEIVFKKYVNVGVAVDTPRGLLVPVVKDVDGKNILQLSAEIVELAEKARSGKIPLDDLQGGTFTITNLGGIGGTSFSPIVNWPEVAILGVSRSAVEPVFLNGEFVPRTLLPLSLSYDHRLIDGADAARFLRWVAEALEDPFLIALEG